MKVCVLKKKYFFVFDCVNVRAVLKRKFPDFFLDNLLAFYLLTNFMTLVTQCFIGNSQKGARYLSSAVFIAMAFIKH